MHRLPETVDHVYVKTLVSWLYSVKAVSGDLGNTGNQLSVCCMFLPDYINGLSGCFFFSLFDTATF